MGELSLSWWDFFWFLGESSSHCPRQIVVLPCITQIVVLPLYPQNSGPPPCIPKIVVLPLYHHEHFSLSSKGG